MKELKDNQLYICLIGPTASGKTDLAIQIAKKYNAIIVNCDSMQIYDALPILTAQPSEEKKSQVKHKLFSYVSASTAYSVAKWAQDVASLLKTNHPQQRYVFVGGTGLYFTALLKGLAIMPEIEDEIRQYWRQRANEEDAQSLHKILQSKDRVAASKIQISDKQRIVRALEIYDCTGKTIQYWQNCEKKGVLNHDKTVKYVLQLAREKIYQNIDKRMLSMVEMGAVQEVQQLLADNLSDDLPIMKAIGVPEFRDFLHDNLRLDEAIAKAQTRSRNYAKRQLTWIRHQLDSSWEPIFPENKV